MEGHISHNLQALYNYYFFLGFDWILNFDVYTKFTKMHVISLHRALN